MLGVVFAQAVTAAHACTSFAVPTSPAAAFGQPVGEIMFTDCPAMATRAAANAKVCESYCAYGQQIDVQPDPPVAAIAPQPALTVRLGVSIVQPTVNATQAATKGGASFTTLTSMQLATMSKEKN